MLQQLVSDEFWARVEPLVPEVERRFRFPGRKRVDDRRCLETMMYVLKTGCQWGMVVESEIHANGKTAWRRMDEWDDAGVWDALHQALLDELNANGQIDWTTGVVDSGSSRAVFGGPSQARTPRIERRKASRTTR